MADEKTPDTEAEAAAAAAAGPAPVADETAAVEATPDDAAAEATPDAATEATPDAAAADAAVEATPDDAAAEAAPDAAAAETVPEPTPDAAADDATPEATPAPAPPAVTRRDRLETRRAQARPAARGQVSPEQREQERQARRAETAKQRRAYRAKLKQRRAASDRSPGTVQSPDRDRGRPRVRQGVVTSAKGDKTITVAIDVVGRHRRYHKILRSTLKLYAHDETNNAAEGDTVRVVECRPMSRSKRWRLTEVLERAK